MVLPWDSIDSLEPIQQIHQNQFNRFIGVNSMDSLESIQQTHWSQFNRFIGVNAHQVNAALELISKLKKTELNTMNSVSLPMALARIDDRFLELHNQLSNFSMFDVECRLSFLECQLENISSLSYAADSPQFGVIYVMP